MTAPKPLTLLFPEEIENWWWAKSKAKWPHSSDEKILNLIREEIVTQSDRFNKERHFTPISYGKRDLSILAYGNFFFPRTWMQNCFVLAEAIDFRGWISPQKGPVRILDLGCGSGPAGLASLWLLRERKIENQIKLHAVDYSGKSLAKLKHLHSENGHLWPQTTLSTERMDLKAGLPKRIRQSFDFILLSSSLNEIHCGKQALRLAKFLSELGAFLKPGGFVAIIEPALKAVCEKLHSATTLLTTESSFKLHAPYFNGSPCPMVSSKSRYYSHEVRRIIPPTIVEKLNQPLGLAIRETKFSFVLLSRKNPVSFPKDPSVVRLVSPLKKSKGAYSFVGISGDAEERTFEIQRRGMTVVKCKRLELLERGDVLRLVKWESLEKERLVRIANAEAFDVLWRPLR